MLRELASRAEAALRGDMLGLPMWAALLAIAAVLIVAILFGRQGRGPSRARRNNPAAREDHLPASRLVVLRDERTSTDMRRLSAHLTDQGDVDFDGQDLGAFVEALFGCREYEWSWTVKAADVPKLRAALGDPSDLIGAIGERFGHERANEIEPFLRTHSIPFEVWTRVGD